MDHFSEKSLQELGDYYVYALLDPRDNSIFYVGKGSGQRVFDHEKETQHSSKEKEKLKIIAEIQNGGYEVKKVIVHCNLTEKEAFAAEAALINAMRINEGNKLTNKNAGKHFGEALSVEDFERTFGAETLCEEDIKDPVMVIKINKRYHRGMTNQELYDAVRACWRASLTKAQKVKYVLGVYNSLVVAVFKPTKWFRCEEAPNKLPAHVDKSNLNWKRIFFVDDNFVNGVPLDSIGEFYLDKSLANIETVQGSQNPVIYLNLNSAEETLKNR